MPRKPFVSISVALQTLRANPLHTLLSTLGIIIGVAALVAILSLGDGMEAFARRQIERTTDLQSIMVSSRTTERIDGVTVRRTSYPKLTVADAERLGKQLAHQAIVALFTRRSAQIRVPDDTVRSGAYLRAVTPNALKMSTDNLRAGRFINTVDVEQKQAVIVLSEPLARRLFGDETELMGRSVLVDGKPAEMVGLLAATEEEGPPLAYVPLGVLAGEGPQPTPPTLVVKAHRVEEVPLVKERIQAWLTEHYPDDPDSFSIQTNEARVEQARRGILMFKLVMGLITGLSVVVGGIGVMNVLLMSVTERTREIGIRKATGARRRDIVVQFLAEAVAVSCFGCFLGLALGMVTILAATPVIRHFTEAPFYAAFNWSTVVIVLVVALLIGVIFGTYPAWRASRLVPVDAIRHE